MAYSFLLVPHSSYKSTVIQIGVAAQTLENLLPDGVCLLVMLLSYGNAKSRTLSRSLPLRQNITPCLLLVLRLFGCVVSSQNLASPKYNHLHYMLTTPVPSKLLPTLSTTNVRNTSRLNATPSERPMTIKYHPPTYLYHSTNCRYLHQIDDTSTP